MFPLSGKLDWSRMLAMMTQYVVCVNHFNLHLVHLILAYTSFQIDNAVIAVV
jgi:hypothetical protein